MTLRIGFKPLTHLLFSGVLLIVYAASISTPSYGQVFYGSLVGTVTDQSGAVVPNASVTATETRRTSLVRRLRMRVDGTTSSTCCPAIIRCRLPQTDSEPWIERESP